MNAFSHLFSSYRIVRPKLNVLAAGVGLLLGAVAPETRAQNLITNGGFETGNFSGWRVIPAERGSDFGVGSLNKIEQVDQGADLFGSPLQSPPFGVPASSGIYAAYYGAVFDRPDAIEQTFRTFSGPLGKYKISFRLKSFGPQPFFFPSRFQAIWNGRVIFETVNTVDGDYQKFVFEEDAKGSHSTLAFQGNQVPGWYFLDEVCVELIGKFADIPDLTPNQHAVAENLDRAFHDSKVRPLFDLLQTQETERLPRYFDRIAAEELTSIFSLGISLSEVQNINLQRRTDDIRRGTSGFSAAGLAINGVAPGYSGAFGITTGVAGPTGRGGKQSKEFTAVEPPERRLGVFLSGTGEWVHVGNTENARGYDIADGGFTLGIDYRVSPNFAIGLAAGYTGSTANLVDNGRVWVNGGKIGVYATFFQNEVAAPAAMSKDSKGAREPQSLAASLAKGFYADVAVSGGYNSYETRRSAIQGEARGDTDGGELSVLVGLGYDFKRGALTFGPTATFEYTYIGTSDFIEHGSLVPLNIQGGDAESLRSTFGIKASYDWKVGGILIRPEIRAAWKHEYGDSTYSLDSSFANGAGGSFTVSGPKLGRDSALLGAGFAIQCSERCSTYFYYDGELGRKEYDMTSVTGGVRFTF